MATVRRTAACPTRSQDDRGRVVAFEKHLLSMKDNNQTSNLEALIAPASAASRSRGATGPRLREEHHRPLPARSWIASWKGARPFAAASSSGKTTLFFTPDPDKTFHRGTTDYFVNERKVDIGAFDSPKFVGLPIGTVTKLGPTWFEMEAGEPLANGDGLNYLHKREVFGVPVNVAEQRGNVWRITPNVAIADLPGFRPARHQPQRRPYLGAAADEEIGRAPRRHRPALSEPLTASR